MLDSHGRRWMDVMEQVMVWKVAGVGRNHHSLRDPKAFAVSLRLFGLVVLKFEGFQMVCKKC